VRKPKVDEGWLAAGTNDPPTSEPAGKPSRFKRAIHSHRHSSTRSQPSGVRHGAIRHTACASRPTGWGILGGQALDTAGGTGNQEWFRARLWRGQSPPQRQARDEVTVVHAGVGTAVASGVVHCHNTAPSAHDRIAGLTRDCRYLSTDLAPRKFALSTTGARDAPGSLLDRSRLRSKIQPSARRSTCNLRREGGGL